MEYIINFLGILTVLSIIGAFAVHAVETENQVIATVLIFGFVWFVHYSVSNYDSIIKISIGG